MEKAVVKRYYVGPNLHINAQERQTWHAVQSQYNESSGCNRKMLDSKFGIIYVCHNCVYPLKFIVSRS